MTEPQTTEAQEPEVGEDDAKLESQSIQHEGKRMVPEAVVAEQRDLKRKALSEVQALKQQLSDQEKLKQFQAQATPILQALQAASRENPDLVQQIMAGKAPSADPAQAPDEELVAIAKDLELYDASGKPDLARAERIRQRDQQRTEALVQERLQPVQEGTVRQQAEANYQWMLSQVSKATGKPIDRQIIDSVVSRVNVADLANRDYATALWATARGVEAENQPAPVAPVGQEPLTVETTGGDPTPVSLSAYQKQQAAESNRSEDDVLKDLEKAVQSGGVLE